MVEWIRKEVTINFFQNSTTPPVIAVSTLVNGTYIPRGLAFKNTVLAADLFINTDSYDIGTGPYNLHVQLKDNKTLLGQAKDLGGATYQGTMYDYPTLFDAITPSLLGIQNMNGNATTSVQCYN